MLGTVYWCGAWRAVWLGRACTYLCARERRVGGAAGGDCDIVLGALGTNKATTSVGQNTERLGTNRDMTRRNIVVIA